ncbi:MAG: hypothetical protein LBP28_05160 [Coriobacteriales bacterium]|jgi:biotin synthase|nr:hypothetical protein [Coriobacteriales bacterium]
MSSLLITTKPDTGVPAAKDRTTPGARVVAPETATSVAEGRTTLGARELLKTEFSQLLEISRAAAQQALLLHPSVVTASPLILTGRCTTTPGCRHCKWEYLKSLGKPSFINDPTVKEVVKRAHALAEIGISRAFFATGWLGLRLPESYLNVVEQVCEAEPRLEYYGLFGALDSYSHRRLAKAGLSGMLTSLESPSEPVYRSFRTAGDSLLDRLRALEYARECGLALWTGFLVGLGEQEDDVVWGLETIARFEPESVSLLPFEPFPHTQMSDWPATDLRWLARVNAAARAFLPPSVVLFTDHYRQVEERFGEAIGFNGSYLTTPLERPGSTMPATAPPLQDPSRREKELL